MKAETTTIIKSIDEAEDILCNYGDGQAESCIEAFLATKYEVPLAYLAFNELLKAYKGNFNKNNFTFAQLYKLVTAAELLRNYDAYLFIRILIFRCPIKQQCNGHGKTEKQMSILKWRE